jgi:hypothetical protein
MKYLNTIITVCFVVVFSGAAYLTTEPAKVIIRTPAYSAPAPPQPGDTLIKSKPGYKSLPKPIIEPKVEEKKPYTEPTPPPPPKDIKPVPVPEHTAMIKEDIANNEYIRGALGAVVGWVVKGICEFLFGIITPILSLAKEALMRRI